MSARLLLSWRNGVSAEAGQDGGLRIRGPQSGVTFRRLAPNIAEALQRLAAPGEEEATLADLIHDGGGPQALAGWFYTLQALASRGLVVRSVLDGGGRLATLVPIANAFQLLPVAAAADRRFLLSRFALLRRLGDQLVLESPQSHCRIVADDERAVAVIGGLLVPRTAQELAARMSGLAPEAIALIFSLIASAGMIDEVGPDGEPVERESGPLACWEFHDLLFHSRIRGGRFDAPRGATYRMEGVMAPPPALKPAVRGETVALFRPDLETLVRKDLSLTQAIESRRSVREYGSPPITANELGEFLFRVARIKDCQEVEIETPRGPLRTTFVSRPFPSGGSLYELEFYTAISTCEGLDPGLYYYEPTAHQLVRMRGLTADVESLLRDAAESAGITRESVQVLLLLSARVPRLAWKYESIAYALILKHVGVVYQTMYLAATAMNLAPCALGSGDSDLFARAAGTDYHTETSVGEFLLGSRKASLAPDGPAIIEATEIGGE